MISFFTAGSAKLQHYMFHSHGRSATCFHPTGTPQTMLPFPWNPWDSHHPHPSADLCCTAQCTPHCTLSSNCKEYI